MKNLIHGITLLLIISVTGTVYADTHISKSPKDVRVYFLEPADGQVVSGDIIVKFGLSGMAVAPAGTDTENSGHHHLLIDVDDDQLPDMTQPLPASDTVVHFGKGQTETQLNLSPGKHTLQLLLGDHMHVPHEAPVISDKITITVE